MRDSDEYLTAEWTLGDMRLPFTIACRFDGLVRISCGGQTTLCSLRQFQSLAGTLQTISEANTNEETHDDTGN